MIFLHAFNTLYAGKNFSRQHFEIFFLFSQVIGFCISFNLSFRDSLHEMSKPITWEKQENIVNLSSAELAQRVVKVKYNKFFCFLSAVHNII